MKQNLRFTLLIGAFLFLSFRISAATYYISSSAGNDDRTSLEAQHQATPWKSLNKLNAFFRYLNSGDSVLFKKGDVFYGSVIASKSGSVFAPIYFGAYGKGSRPMITGFSTLQNWKPVKSGIYESECEASGNNLIINGAQQALGRYPNKGYLTYESHQGNTSITDNGLTGEWTGAEVVIRKNRWIIDRSTITAQNGGTISYTPTSAAVPTNGFGYFIQKDIRTLDLFGEWFYDTQRKAVLVYFGSKNPSAYNVKVSTVNNLVSIRRFNYLTFENLAFSGSADNTFNIIQAKNITLRGCSIDQSGAEAVFANYTPFVTVINCSINHSLSGGIDLDAGCANSLLQENLITNTGLFAGMGKSGTGTYEAVTSFGDNTKIEKNHIDSTGYDGIYFGGNHSFAKNNYITYFCLTKDDGAGIYLGDWTKTVNKKVTGNIILHGIGNGEGTTYPNSLQAEGIYIDDNTESVTISDNTVSLCANNGIKIHNAREISISNNVVYNNGVQLRLEQDHYLATSGYIRDNDIRNNTFYSKNAMQSAAKFSTQQDDIQSFGHIDSNYYCRSGNSASATMLIARNGKYASERYNLSDWKSAYGKDKSSKEGSAAEAVLFEVNPNNTVRTVMLKQPYVDVHNRVYTDRVIIEPYSSVLLLASNQRTAGTGTRTTLLASR